MKQRLLHTFFLPAVIFILAFPFGLFSQTVPELDARRAVYSRVDQYKSRVIGNVDSVILADASGFAVDDTVLFFQTVGGDPDLDGEIFQFYYTGKYAIMKIQEVSGNTVVFNSTLPDMAAIVPKPYEIAQLVKIPTYKRVRVTDAFTNDSAYWKWNPASNTGGVFALIAGKLELETDFSANGQGFRGGVPDGNYNGVCSDLSGDTIYERVGMFTNAADSAGRKGESYARQDYPYTKGFENVGSGGGGGNGKYSGGGGGGNSGYGAKGGFESETCSPAQDIGGKRGEVFNYNNTGGFSYNRIFLGGGGGTGTQNPALERFATKGGDGGGILIIMVDTLIGNGFSVTANGESVTALATAGAGGGGGGGVIILDAGYRENVNFRARGGNGGSISTSFEKSGPGGAGGGGVVWYSQNILTPLQISVAAGKSGTIELDKYGADGAAGVGVAYPNLVLPLKGFIINPLPEDQSICEGEIPGEFLAAKPKGGDGTYSYQWLRSESILPASFTPISGAVNMTYQHNTPITKTTYFKRRVTTGTISDETFYITVEVTPKINNNIIAANDTICRDLAPDPLTGSAEPLLSGGLGSSTYSIRWQSRGETGGWSDIQGATDINYNPGSLNDTTYFRRVVESGVCTDFSDSVSIIVLPLLTGNTPSTTQNIYCNNQEILPIASANPVGGDGNYSYQWESKTGSGDWTPAVTTRDFPAIPLPSDGSAAQTYLYRRTVFSGPENTCQSLSPEVSLTVLPDITNNSISVSQDTLCAGLPSITIPGSSPSGGDGEPYSYRWEFSSNGTSSWATGSGNPGERDYQPGSLGGKRYFRRVVTDGEGGVCTSTSNVQIITVLPSITNNIITTDQDQCVGEVPDPLNGAMPAGGDGTYDYLWQGRKASSALWQNILETGSNYSPPQLDDADNYDYRRIVFSGENNTCTDTSAEVTIHVEAQITGNTLDVNLIEACYNSEVTLPAASATGGDGLVPDYTWQDSLSGETWQNIVDNFSAEDYLVDNLNNRIWYRRIAVSKSGLCSSLSDVVLADTLTLPVITGLTSSADTICDDESFSLYLNFESREYGPFEVEYTNGKESLTASGVTDSIYFATYNRPFEDFNFKVTSLSDVNNCFAVGDFSDIIPLWVNDAPSPQIVKPSDPFEFCGPVFQLASIPDLNPGVSAGWWDTGTGSRLSVSDPSAASGGFSIPLPFNVYSDTVFFRQQSSSCGTRSDTLLVFLYEQPDEPVIFRGDETTLFITDQDTLLASTPSAGTFEWTLVSGNATIEDPQNNPVRLNNIPLDVATLLRYTISNGVCTSRNAEIQITRREVNVFDGISPQNQDGQNDYLVAEGLDSEGVSFNFQIFSTNGLLVREITQEDLAEIGLQNGLPNNGLELWDGKDKNGNNYVPLGTYYYVLTIDFKGTEFIDKGFLLVR